MTAEERPVGRREWTPVPAVGVAVHARVWDGPADAAGPPVVLVAGLGVSSRYWARLGWRLAGRFRVLAPDLPGFGRTRRPPGVRWPGGSGAGQQADQLLAWMDARGLGRVVLCGQSVGCQTAVEVATRCPERVERLVLMAAPFEPGRRTFAACLPRLVAGALFEVPSLLPVLVLEYGSAGLPRAVQQAGRAMRYPFERKLAGVAMPTLVVHGEHDTVASRRWAQTIAARLPRAALVEVGAVGHAMHYSAAAVTAAVVTDFLTGRFSCDDRVPAGGAVVVPADDPVRDRLGPPQVVSPRAHDWLGRAAAAVAMLSLPVRYGRRSRGVLSAAAALNLLLDAASAPSATGRRRLPRVTNATADVVCGLAAAVVAGTWLRREPAAGRRAVVLFGLYQMASGLLTGKPTGPVRRWPVRR